MPVGRMPGVAAAAAVAFVALMAGCSSRGSSGSASLGAGTTTTLGGPPKAAPVPAGATLAAWVCPKVDGSSPRTTQFPPTPPPMCIGANTTYTAQLTTSEGVVDFTLDTKNTPVTANNYIVLSLYHYYDGTTIDRIDTSIDILQTGSPKTQDIGDPGPGYAIPDEGSGYSYSAGDVVMARGSAPNSAAAQYFFVVGPKGSLLDGQGTYVTFGRVTAGLDVLQRIEGLFEPCTASDPTCLGGAPSRVVTISHVAITST